MELSAVRFYEADAMVDTGSVQTVMPYDVVKRLGLETPRQRGVESADGRKEVVRLRRLLWLRSTIGRQVTRL